MSFQAANFLVKEEKIRKSLVIYLCDLIKIYKFKNYLSYKNKKKYVTFYKKSNNSDKALQIKPIL